MIHWLKTEKRFFDDVWAHDKPFELRENDRGFEIGDVLILGELDPKNIGKIASTVPRALIARVTSIVTADEFSGLVKGYVALGIVILARIDEEPNGYGGKLDELVLFEYRRMTIQSEQWASKHERTIKEQAR